MRGFACALSGLFALGSVSAAPPFGLAFHPQVDAPGLEAGTDRGHPYVVATLPDAKLAAQIRADKRKRIRLTLTLRNEGAVPIALDPADVSVTWKDAPLAAVSAEQLVAEAEKRMLAKHAFLGIVGAVAAPVLARSGAGASLTVDGQQYGSPTGIADPSLAAVTGADESASAEPAAPPQVDATRVTADLLQAGTLEPGATVAGDILYDARPRSGDALTVTVSLAGKPVTFRFLAGSARQRR